MDVLSRRLVGLGALGCWLSFCQLVLVAQQKLACGEKVSLQIRVDSGHPWRPPFGLDRVGAPPVVHVDFAAERVPVGEYFVVGYRGTQETERHALKLAGKKSSFVDTAPLQSLPEEVRLISRCGRGGELVELARQPIKWPDFEAEATARPERLINPVDLGTILVPHDWLLLAGGQTAVVDVAAISRTNDIPHARLRAWFENSKPVETSFALTAKKRSTTELRVPLTLKTKSTVLHVSLSDGNRELWKKEIRTMIVAEKPRWPAFGAVETKLRYDAPVSVNDPRTGAPLPSIDYSTAWNPKLNDVVVFLPNGSRFVFWRGSSYAPFWAGPYNTGFSYQWAETIPPPGFIDAVEPLQDKELRYGRVRVIEATRSRVHVRWTYQSVDFQYRSLGDEATEDFYFYPDGFGTRVVTLASTRGDDYAFSEFIILSPQKAFPLEVLPNPTVDMLFLDGEKKRVTFPLAPGTYGGLTIKVPPGQEASIEQHSVERLLGKVMEYQGKDVAPFVVDLVNQGLGKITHRRHTPIMYRVFPHQKDPDAAIYFSPYESNSTIAFLPFYDRGELVTPGYWGNHWPLGRGALTGGAIDDRIYSSPSHFSLMDLSEPKPISRGEVQMMDTFGHSQSMTLQRWAWLIGKTGAPDDVLLEWAQSFSNPPSLELAGARIDFPSYSLERRAIRLVAESPSIEIKLKPRAHTVNPVFELDQARREIVGVTLDGKVLTADAYAWDGMTFWVKANIGVAGATIGVRFR
jgi:hypothetical protein